MEVGDGRNLDLKLGRDCHAPTIPERLRFPRGKMSAREVVGGTLSSSLGGTVTLDIFGIAPCIHAHLGQLFAGRVRLKSEHRTNSVDSTHWFDASNKAGLSCGKGWCLFLLPGRGSEVSGAPNVLALRDSC